MNAVVLAAGKGARLGELMKSLPKPLLPIDGKPILEHNIEWCRKNGVDKIFINLHHLPEAIRAHCGDGSKWGVSIAYKQEDSLLGTSGAVKNFERELGGEPFLVLYGDNWVDYDLAAMARRHAAEKADMSLAVFQLEDVRSSGVATLDAADRVVEFIEKPARGGGGWANMGVYVMNPALLADISPGFSDFGKDVIPRLIRQGRKILGLKMDHKVKAVDTPALYREWL